MLILPFTDRKSHVLKYSIKSGINIRINSDVNLKIGAVLNALDEWLGIELDKSSLAHPMNNKLVDFISAIPHLH